ncbi:MAG: chromate efflux transporter [Bryobacteraceae bacterium]|nr:chromate efflux transporter [Bryobacteraceae bacterium]
MPTPSPAAVERRVSFREAFWCWCKVALLSFGGPAGQIAVMHRILVEEKRWVSESRFLHALNYCMLLPGPEAQQLATYIGWLLHRAWGGLVAGSLFVLPGFVSILALSILYADYKQSRLVDALFYGLAPAVMAIVVEAVIRIGKRSLKNAWMAAVAGLAFLAIFFFAVPFPLIVAAAALAGLAGARLRPDKFLVIRMHQPKPGAESAAEDAAIADDADAHTEPTALRAVKVSALWLTLWLGPVAVLIAAYGWNSVWAQQGVFFSKAAVVTFGGAYAVLAYVAQQAVSAYGWLQPGEMLDGLGMAETTPGPLIQVVQFVGFMGAYRAAEAGQLPGVSPISAGVLAAILTTWVTFTPCFLWIFLGAPYIERLRGNKSLTAALSTITAAVVGVVLNLAVWFALHTVFGRVHEVRTGPLRLLIPEWGAVDWAALLIAAGAFAAVFFFRLGMIRTLLAAVLAGLAYRLALAA